MANIGISTYAANKLLEHLVGKTSWTMPSGIYAKIHTGQPGAAGTSNASAQTTRLATTFAAATGGSIAINNTPEFTLNATETITHISFWDAATGGNFLWSAAASVAKGGASGDIIRISTNSLTLGALAS